MLKDQTQAPCTWKKSCQNKSKDQQEASSSLSTNPNIANVVSSSINPDAIFKKSKGKWEESGLILPVNGAKAGELLNY